MSPSEKRDAHTGRRTPWPLRRLSWISSLEVRGRSPVSQSSLTPEDTSLPRPSWVRQGKCDEVRDTREGFEEDHAAMKEHDPRSFHGSVRASCTRQKSHGSPSSHAARGSQRPSPRTAALHRTRRMTWAATPHPWRSLHESRTSVRIRSKHQPTSNITREEERRWPSSASICPSTIWP